jgi:RimJ/RimL family protein N-acetyltransferase
MARILIGAKMYRGKGIGEQVVRKMVALFFEDPGVIEVDLNVFDWNTGAIRCYEKVGFKINHAHSKTLHVNGKTWALLNMQLSRET